MRLLNTKRRRRTPQCWLQLQRQLLLGVLIGMGVTWELTDVFKTTHIPFRPRLAV